MNKEVALQVLRARLNDNEREILRLSGKIAETAGSAKEYWTGLKNFYLGKSHGLEYAIDLLG